MIQTFGRALRRAAGGGVIFTIGVVAASSQPAVVVATSAASVLPVRQTQAEAASLQADATSLQDERAALLAIRAGQRAATAVSLAPVTVAKTATAKSHRALASKSSRPAPVAAAPATAALAARANPAGPAAGNSSGYAYGYCTWWVSHKRYIPWHSNAAQWWWSARAYGFAEGATPRVGAVMVMGYGVGGASASSGHVAYVESVNANGSFVISEMNWWGVAGGGWGKVDYRTVTSMSGILGFIY